MDLSMDLNALLSQLQSAQQARTSAKLSERNVIELINKLKQLGILKETEVLHTINGKEYLTQERLKAEVTLQLKQAGGRVALIELPALLGVDSAHCDRQAAAIVAGSKGEVVEVQGELITSSYFDSIAAEINEQLQDTGKMHIGELAAAYSLATELLVGVINARLGVPGGIDGACMRAHGHIAPLPMATCGALAGMVERCMPHRACMGTSAWADPGCMAIGMASHPFPPAPSRALPGWTR